MKFVIQCTTQASVTIDQKLYSEIGKGFLVLIGICDEDTKETADKIVPVVKTGVFGAEMEVALINDGPFTIILDSKDLA